MKITLALSAKDAEILMRALTELSTNWKCTPAVKEHTHLLLEMLLDAWEEAK